MSGRILFLVQNGIGFGNIRRTILLAETIRALDPEIDIIFLIQSRSLLLLERSPFRVINFPFVHRLPGNASEHAYKVLLHQIVASLNPSLVVEDTYPDSWYLSIPALRDIAKIFLLGRLTAPAFDGLRREGFFSLYDRIILIQERDDFFTAQLTADSRLLVELGHKFVFTGPLIYRPTALELEGVRAEYGQDDSPLIVVNAGAGGDHLNDAYCERLFASMRHVAARFLESGMTARFVFVLGPYYRGAPPEPLPNLRALNFEPRLAALLSIARVAVIRPGANVTYEALAGPAQVVLVPGISYMEDQFGWARSLKERYQLEVADPSDADGLFELTKHQLLRGPRDLSPAAHPEPVQKTAALVIEELRNALDGDSRREELAGVRAFFLLGNVAPAHLNTVRALFHEHGLMPSLVIEPPAEVTEGDVPGLPYVRQSSGGATRQSSEGYATAFLHSPEPIQLTARMLADWGVRVVFYTDQTTIGIGAKEWCELYPLRGLGILEKQLCHLRVRLGWQAKLLYRLSKLARGGAVPAIYLDLSALEQGEDVAEFASDFVQLLRSHQLQLVSLGDCLDRLAMSALSPPEKDSGGLEIEKLN